MSDTVCVHRDQIKQFHTERRGYYYAHPDYHQLQEEEGEADGYKVYDSEEPKSEMPEVFGRRKFHGNPSNNNNNSGDSKSLTSQIVSQRLNESGQLSFKQKLETFQSGRSDFGRPTFYSGGDGGGGRGGGGGGGGGDGQVTNNAVSSDASPVLEVAKVFLGDGNQNRQKTLGRSRQRNFGDIRNLFPNNKKSQGGWRVRPGEVTPGAILQPPPTTSTTSIVTITSTTSTNRGTPMMSVVVPGREVEVETRQPAGGSGGIHHHLVLVFCLLSILVVVLVSVLAYLVINRGQATNKFNILDNLGIKPQQRNES